MKAVDEDRRQARLQPRRDVEGKRAARVLAARAKEVADLLAGGHSVCIVSSGAIALGAPRLGFARRPSTMRQLQAASAVGQAQLQQAWERAFGRVGIQAAQILLSPADVGDRQTYVNVCNTFDALFRLGRGPGRERERCDGDRRDHLRRQRLAGGAGRRPDARATAGAAHRGRRCLLARTGNAWGGAARRRLADVRRPAGPRDGARPRRDGEQDRGRAARRRRGHSDRDRVRPGRVRARPDRRRGAERHSLRQRRCARRVGVQALDQAREAAAWHASCSMRAPSRRCARRVRASSPSA